PKPTLFPYTTLFRSHAQQILGKERHLLYVVTPGIRNYLEFGGAGIAVFDMDKNHAFVKRIKTPASQVKNPENIKGVCACAATQRSEEHTSELQSRRD